jgi:hypothetical protein
MKIICWASNELRVQSLSAIITIILVSITVLLVISHHKLVKESFVVYRERSGGSYTIDAYRCMILNKNIINLQ